MSYCPRAACTGGEGMGYKGWEGGQPGRRGLPDASIICHRDVKYFILRHRDTK